MNIFLIFNKRNQWRLASKIRRTFHCVDTGKEYNVTTDSITGRTKSICHNFLNKEIKKGNQIRSLFNISLNWDILKNIQTNKNCWNHLHIRPYVVKRNDLTEKTVNVKKEVEKKGKREWNKEQNGQTEAKEKEKEKAKEKTETEEEDQEQERKERKKTKANIKTKTKTEENRERKRQQKCQLECPKKQEQEHKMENQKINVGSQKLQEKEKKKSVWSNEEIFQIENIEGNCIKKRFKVDKEILINLKKEENEKCNNIERTGTFVKQEDVCDTDTFKINRNEMKKGNDNNIDNRNIDNNNNFNNNNDNNSDNNNNDTNNSYFQQRNESSLDKNMLGKNSSILNGKNQVNSANYSMYIETEKEIMKNVNDRLQRIGEKNIKGLKKNEKSELLNCYIKKLKNNIHNLFEKHLLIMNCVIAGTLYFIADITCQLMEKQKEKMDYDFFRTFRMAFIGISLEGPIMTWWYGKILTQFVKSKPNNLFYKSFMPTIFDNFIFGPIHLTVFFFYNGILMKQCKEEIKEKIQNTGLRVFIISLMIWTPLTLTNFAFVPRVYQATVIFFADFFWVNFLSWNANKKV